jgi:heme exporter protein D
VTNQQWLFVFMTLLAIAGWVCASVMQHRLYKLQARVRGYVLDTTIERLTKQVSKL